MWKVRDGWREKSEGSQGRQHEKVDGGWRGFRVSMEYG